MCELLPMKETWRYPVIHRFMPLRRTFFCIVLHCTALYPTPEPAMDIVIEVITLWNTSTSTEQLDHHSIAVEPTLNIPCGHQFLFRPPLSGAFYEFRMA